MNGTQGPSLQRFLRVLNIELTVVQNSQDLISSIYTGLGLQDLISSIYAPLGL